MNSFWFYVSSPVSNFALTAKENGPMEKLQWNLISIKFTVLHIYYSYCYTMSFIFDFSSLISESDALHRYTYSTEASLWIKWAVIDWSKSSELEKMFIAHRRSFFVEGVAIISEKRCSYHTFRWYFVFLPGILNQVTISTV